MEVEDAEFEEEFLSQEDPSMLHFLLASGEQVSSQQLRDDLMTLLIAGHETTAAVLTWTLHCLVQHPQFVPQLQEEVHTSLESVNLRRDLDPVRTSLFCHFLAVAL